MARVYRQEAESNAAPLTESERWAGLYRCSACGALVEMHADDIDQADSRHRVEDWDGKGKRIRTVPTSSGYKGSPCCQSDAWLREARNPLAALVFGLG